MLDILLDGDLIDADEIDDRLARLDAFEADVLGRIKRSCASSRAVLSGLRGTRLVRAMDFTDPEEVAAEVDEIIAGNGVPPGDTSDPADMPAAWLEEIVAPPRKGHADVTLSGGAEGREAASHAPTALNDFGISERPPTPAPLSVTGIDKGNADITLSDGPPAALPEADSATAEGDARVTLPESLARALPPLETMLEWAHFWAGQGVRVFPLHEVYDGICTCTCTKKCKGGDHKCGSECESKGKHPRTFNGLTDATTDPKRVSEWWARWPHANIGGVMGAPGNLVALDFDPRHGGDASFTDLVEAHGSGWLDTLTHRTGSGGFHLFYQYTPDVELRNSAGKVAPGVDTRGEGGYVVLPPSLHASSASYEVLKVAEVKPVPAWLLAVLRDEPTARVIDFQEMRGRRTFAVTSGEVFYDGTRNVGLFGVGLGRWRHGWARNLVELHAQLSDVNSARCSPPLDGAEVAEMAAHIARDYAHLCGIDGDRKGAA